MRSGTHALDFCLIPCHTNRVKQTRLMLTNTDIQNILTLIDFHDDWDEVKEVWGFDIEPLHAKLCDMLTYSSEG